MYIDWNFCYSSPGIIHFAGKYVTCPWISDIHVIQKKMVVDGWLANICYQCWGWSWIWIVVTDDDNATICWAILIHMWTNLYHQFPEKHWNRKYVRNMYNCNCNMFWSGLLSLIYEGIYCLSALRKGKSESSPVAKCHALHSKYSNLVACVERSVSSFSPTASSSLFELFAIEVEHLHSDMLISKMHFKVLKTVAFL